MKRFTRVSMWTIVCLLLVLNLINAQDVWMMPQNGSYISAEYFTPSLKSSYSGLSINQDVGIHNIIISGAVALTNGDRVKFDMPLVWFNKPEQKEVYSYPWGTVTYSSPAIHSNGVGNFSVAYEIKSSSENSTFDIGVRLPLASETQTAPAIGMIADLDRVEMYLPNVLTLFLQANIIHESENLFLQFHTGPSVMILTKSYSGSDKAELYYSAAISAGFRIGAIKVGAGYSGKLLLTENGDITDRLIHQIGGLASMKFGQLEPGFFIRIPVDKNYSELIKYILGFNLAYTF